MDASTAEEKQQADLDKKYKTPSFSVPQFDEKEKLRGYRNYRAWKSKMELALKANMLLPFIHSENGIDEVNISNNYRTLLNARTMQVLQASVTRSVALQIQHAKSPYEAFCTLEKMYSTTKMRDYAELNNRFQQLRFKIGYDPARFFADYENCVEDFLLAGTTFNDEYIAITFLQKLPQIYEPGTLYASFYNNMTSVAEIKKYEEIRSIFLQLDHDSLKNKEKRKANEPNTDEYRKKQRFSTNLSSNSTSTSGTSSTSGNKPPRYTPEQREKLKKMTKEEKLAVMCRKCGEYFHETKSCDGPGKLCYNCNTYGHISGDCKKPQKRNKGNENKNLRKISVLIDSGASHHIVYDCDLLENFIAFDSPKMVTTAFDTDGQSVGEGNLSIFLKFESEFTPFKLQKVQYVPEIFHNIISSQKFNEQFLTLITFDSNCGTIYSSNLKQKLSLIEVANGVYTIDVYTPDRNSILLDRSDAPPTNFIPNCNKPMDPNKVLLNSDKVICLRTRRNKTRKAVRKLTTKQVLERKLKGHLWHRRLGHISTNYLQHLKHATEGTDDLLISTSVANCNECARAKLKRKPYTKKRDRVTRVGEILHTDIVGPIQPPTKFSNNRYFLTVIDDFSRYLQIFLLKSHSEVPQMLNEAYRFIRAKFPNPGQFNLLRSDNAPEFLSTKTTAILNKYDVRVDTVEPYCHQHNGLIERIQETIPQRARALLFESGFPETMWGVAVSAACWIYNRTPHAGLNFRTPFELFVGKKPNLGQIRIFGSRVYVYDENVPLGRKFQSRSTTSYLIGYTSTGYRVFDPKTMTFNDVCNVVIDETKLFKDDFPNITNEKLRIDLFSTFSRISQKCTCPLPNVTSDSTQLGGDKCISHTPENSIPELTRSGGGEKEMKVNQETACTTATELTEGNSELRLVDDLFEDTSNTDIEVIEQTIDYDWDPISINFAKLCLGQFGEFDPTLITNHRKQELTYRQATTGPDCNKWCTAIEKELNAITKYDVWDLVPRQKDKYAIPIKWVFTIKSNGTYKAHLVVVGCRDKTHASKLEAASPTPCSGSIRWLFSIASKFGWQLHHLDIPNAFLHGTIDREKFVAIPPGIQHDPKKYMFKLKKALYGLDVAPVCFNHEIDNYLKSIGFQQNQREACIYTKWNTYLLALLLVFVDDFLITGDDSVGIRTTIEQLQSKYETKTLGFPRTFVGIKIEKNSNHLFLHQRSYI